jgi:hypothetical protein
MLSDSHKSHEGYSKFCAFIWVARLSIQDFQQILAIFVDVLLVPNQLLFLREISPARNGFPR